MWQRKDWPQGPARTPEARFRLENTMFESAYTVTLIYLAVKQILTEV